VNLLRRLWAQEPVIVRGALSLAISAGVLTATQASAVGDAISAVVVAVGLVAARGKVQPATPKPPHQPEHAAQQ
jgi:hypothetical protein